MLSAMDLLVIKIKELERENERKDIRLSALRCRLAELLDSPPKIVVVINDEV